ncbi:MAG TPA: ShlB/FhaC/HecB family hemolysin secretion/activation protein [Tepidisphaeraceae bacterium]|nr:ShlB/FhaC/HecB family hemolysin secretion/activation protein [Tepidisphaeraceae bacterium]
MIAPRRATLALAILGLVSSFTTRADTPPDPDARRVAAQVDAARQADAKAVFKVGAFDVRYEVDHPALPPIAAITAAPIELGEIDETFVVPPALERRWLAVQAQVGEDNRHLRFTPSGAAVRKTTIDELSRTGGLYHPSAIWAINEQVRRFLNARGVLGVHAAPADDQAVAMAAGHEVPRARLTISIGRVREVRTTAGATHRPAEPVRTNAPEYAWIAANSPVGAQPGRDLVRRELLDEYVFTLNRHPARHVDVAVSSAGYPGEVILDYVVTETDPLTLTAETSNTGTKDTREWRQRFALVHNQLTARDDVLSIDYTTAGFDDYHDVRVAYEFPISPTRTVRGRVYGSFTEFAASDVALALGPAFDGTRYTAGAEIIATVFQRRELFVDAVAGVRYEHASADHAGQSGSADFVVPYAGLRLAREGDIESTHAELFVEGRFTGASRSDLDALGRPGADGSAVVLRGKITHSFFLEPLLMPERFRAAQSSLAHEVVLSARAQTAFGARLIPTARDVLGGFDSVRGYDEASAAGDSALLASAEYRWHVPRSLPINPNPRPLFARAAPFHWAPDRPYARPDWDLIFLAFVDAGQTFNAGNNDHDETLVGIGLGVELQFKQNAAVRVDWGIPLTDLDAPGATTPDSRVHVRVGFSW